MATHGEIRWPPVGTFRGRLWGDSHGRRQLGAFDWTGTFEPPPEQFATDGVDWNVAITYGDGASVRCDGYNAYPPAGDDFEDAREFRRFCQAVSRLLGARYFGWEQARQPAEAAAKGSQLRIRQWINDHRERFEAELLSASPTLREWAAGPINWLAPLSPGFKEPRDDLWPLLLVHPTPQEVGWWPRRGPVWDAAGVVPGKSGLGIVLVEAKSHEAELRSPRAKPSSEKSREMIEDALQETKDALKVPPEVSWMETYYQVANRVAFLHWLHRHADKAAWLVNVYFVGDRFVSGGGEVVGPATQEAWSGAISEAKSALHLPETHALSPWIVNVFLPAEPRIGS